MNTITRCIAASNKNDSGSVSLCAPKDLRTAVAAGISSGKGFPSDKVFNRLKTKYRNLAKEQAAWPALTKNNSSLAPLILLMAPAL